MVCAPYGNAAYIQYGGSDVLVVNSTGSAFTGAVTASGTITSNAGASANGGIINGVAGMGPFAPASSSTAWFGKSGNNSTTPSGMIDDGTHTDIYAGSGTSGHVRAYVNGNAMLDVSATSVNINEDTNIGGSLTANATGTAISAPNGNITAGGIISSTAGALTNGAIIAGNQAMASLQSSTGSWTGFTGFNTSSNSTWAGYAMGSGGDLVLQAPSGHNIYFQNAGTEIAEFNGSGMIVKSTGTAISAPNGGISAGTTITAGTAIITGTSAIIGTVAVWSGDPGTSAVGVQTTSTSVLSGTTIGDINIRLGGSSAAFNVGYTSKILSITTAGATVGGNLYVSGSANFINHLSVSGVNGFFGGSYIRLTTSSAGAYTVPAIYPNILFAASGAVSADISSFSGAFDGQMINLSVNSGSAVTVALHSGPVTVTIPNGSTYVAIWDAPNSTWR
jgi:hypothetical protein